MSAQRQGILIVGTRNYIEFGNKVESGIIIGGKS